MAEVTAAQSPTTPPSTVLAYPASSFAAFKPSSAQDMVTRVPGFTASAGDANVRGFAGSVGNILIDGQRPTSKAVSINDLLGRIPPEAVERIELIRGGAPGIDMQGQAVVVNVVRRKGARVSREAQLWTKLYPDHAPARIAYLIGSRASGALSLEGTLHYRREAHYDTGDGQLERRNGALVVTTAGPFVSRVDSKVTQASGSAEYQQGANTWRVNLGLDRTEVPRAERASLVTAAGVAAPERMDAQQTSDRAELGLDFVRHLAGERRTRLVGLYTYKDNTLRTSAVTPTTGTVSTKEATAGEGLVRATLNGFRPFGVNLEGGGEGAFNYLNSRSSLAINGAGQVVPSANVRVQETRAEAFVTANAEPLDNVTLEARLRYEVSRISQSGDVSRARSFAFAKPRVVVSWSPSPRTQLRLRLERLVGQLNFEDFAATGDLLAGSISAGNADLTPERAWLGEVAVERGFGKAGAVVVTVSRSQVQDVLDFIPTPGGFDAPGNIGDGVRTEARLDLSVPLGGLGLQDARLSGNGVWRQSKVHDAVTGERRRISRERPFEGSISLTQNLASLNSSYTLQVNTFGFEERSYRFSEVRNDQETYQLKFYWDVRPRPGLNIRLQAENFVGKERRRFRTLYAGSRALSSVRQYEARAARFQPFAMIRVRQSF